MTEVLQANIFFIIASVATVIFCLLVSLVLFQIYQIVKVARTILERIDAASETVAGDAAQLREFIARGGMFATIAKLFMKTKQRRNRRVDDEEA